MMVMMAVKMGDDDDDEAAMHTNNNNNVKNSIMKYSICQPLTSPPTPKTV